MTLKNHNALWNRVFQATCISGHISETVQDRASVIINH